MNFPILRTVSASAALAALLTACGGAPADDINQATVQTGVATTRAAVGTPPPPATAATGNAAPTAAITPANPNMPAPDCAADGCSSPRIIDGNAEAARYAAVLRAAANTPQT